MKTDGSNKQRLSDDIAANINVLGDNLFYSVASEPSAEMLEEYPFTLSYRGTIAPNPIKELRMMYYDMITIKTDGSERKNAFDVKFAMSEFIAIDDKVFFWGGIPTSYYSLPLDSEEARFISDSITIVYGIRDGNLYCSSDSGISDICVLDIDTNTLTRLSDEDTRCSKVNITDERIFYYAEVRKSVGNGYAIAESGIYSMAHDGSDKKRVSEDPADGGVIVSHGKIYYIYYNTYNPDDENNGSIFSIEIDGSDKKKLSDEDAQFLSVAGDWIFYVNYNENEVIHKRMRLDGSELQYA